MSCKDLNEFDVQLRVLLVDLRAHIGNDLVDAAVAVALQPHGEVAVIGLGHGGETQLDSGAPRSALHFRRRRENLFDAQQHLVGVRQSRSGRHDVVENESAFIHCRQQVAAERPIAEVGADDQRDAGDSKHQRISQHEAQRALIAAGDSSHEAGRRNMPVQIRGFPGLPGSLRRRSR